MADFRFVNGPCHFITIDAIIGNQAFQNGRCHISFSLGLDKVETVYNLLMEYHALAKCLIVHIHTGLLRLALILFPFLLILHIT